MGHPPVHPLVVGFDLDMTLMDTRPGIAAAYRALSAETGVFIDVDAVVGRIGPPLRDEIARWFPAGEVDGVIERYRELYREHAIAPSVPLPGAAEALAAVRAQHGRAVVITSKHARLARPHLEHAGLEVDEIVGEAFGDGKTAALRDRGAGVYVGDFTADITSGTAAGAATVGVPTGHIPAGELAAAGATVVLPDLTGFPEWLEEYLRPRRLDALMASLRGLDGLMVAFSGGADSAFVLAAAVRALGADKVLAATAVSPSLPKSELTGAAAFAAGLGVRHLTPHTHEMDRDGYRANAGDRCYFCKAELMDTLGPVAGELAVPHVATGTNADDAVAGFRPGIRAAAERGALTPLRDAGLTKAQVRRISADWGLSTADKPAAACLSSRIAYGIQISPSRLRRVERAERDLRAALDGAGLRVVNLRVRDLGDTARVELDADLLPVLAGRPDTDDLLAAVKGFGSVELDPRGFRSGSMNELLPTPDR